jgi:RNA polymerase sigma-70 factor, ECF subfamily
VSERASAFLALPQWSALLLAAAQRWPGVRVDGERYAAYLSAHPAADALLARLPSLEQDDGFAELFLVCALHTGDQTAAAVFERTYLSNLEQRLARMKLAATDLDEIRQRVLQKLLVPEQGIVRIEQYAGQGKLAGLVHVAATREALDLLRRKRDTHSGVDNDAPDVAPWDVGLELARAQYREAFRPAFEQAVAALTTRERSLLRMHLVGGVTLEDLSAAYNVHRATIVRWLAGARASILDGTKQRLQTALAIRADELESLMALAQSGLDVSVERLLRSDAEISPGKDEAH